MLTAHEAQNLMPDNSEEVVKHELAHVEHMITVKAKEGQTYVIWRGVGRGWPDKIQATMYRMPGREADISLVNNLLDRVREAGYTVEEYEQYSSLVDLGYTISWA